MEEFFFTKTDKTDSNGNAYIILQGLQCSSYCLTATYKNFTAEALLTLIYTK
jgi:hypothetical protein